MINNIKINKKRLNKNFEITIQIPLIIKRRFQFNNRIFKYFLTYLEFLIIDWTQEEAKF